MEKGMVLHLKKLNPHHPWMLYVEFGLKIDIGPVIMEKKTKIEKADNDGQQKIH